MQAYETMLLTKAGLEDEERGAITERVQTIVSEGGGKWDTIDDWGRRKTAYEINKTPDAHYQVLYFESDVPTVDEVRRVLSITEGVVREMTVRRVPEVTQELKDFVAAQEEADGERRERRSKRGGSGGGGGGRDRGDRGDRGDR